MQELYREDTKLISVDEYPRVKIWDYKNHTISKEGFILVCDYPRDYTNNTCSLPESKTIKADTVDGWQIMQHYKIPGHIVKAYELRSNGKLIVYFKPISTKQ